MKREGEEGKENTRRMIDEFKRYAMLNDPLLEVYQYQTMNDRRSDDLHTYTTP